MTTGIYTTRIKNCVVPHYKKTGGESEELFKNFIINSVFEREIYMYNKYGNKISSAISGICISDLFTHYGLTQRDEYVKTLFSTISCYEGKDSVISFLIATRPYRIKTSSETCPNNIVFEKNTLIVPRGEILWSLLGIPGDKIGMSSDPNNFKIYIQSVDEADPIHMVTTSDEEFKTHKEHLKITSIAKHTDATTRPELHYVTLNPFIYTRIKAYRCIDTEGRNLDEQYFMLHKMNLLYSQSIGALSVIPVGAKRLLQYPPGTRESICCKEDTLHIGVPKSYCGEIDNWARKDSAKQGQAYDYTGKVPKNTVVFPECENSDVCKNNRDGFHNFIQQYENSHIVKIREEYADIKPSEDIPKCFDDTQRSYWFKFIKNTYPTQLKFRTEVVSSFTPNCRLTPIGVVALRRICEGDPLIFDSNALEIDQIHSPHTKSLWDCAIEQLEIPEYKQLADDIKPGESKTTNARVSANPLSYSGSPFVTSLGTNITILPRHT
jgi:hypothetical protein